MAAVDHGLEEGPEFGGGEGIDLTVQGEDHLIAHKARANREVRERTVVGNFFFIYI